MDKTDHSDGDHMDDSHKDSDDMTHDSGEHEHEEGKEYEFVSHDGLPEVKINSVSDNSDGTWALDFTTANFTFDEAAVDSDNVPGTGHAHLYINDEKIGRVFDESYTIEQDLDSGDTVTVSLFTNDHQAYTHDGVPIRYSYNIP